MPILYAMILDPMGCPAKTGWQCDTYIVSVKLTLLNRTIFPLTAIIDLTGFLRREVERRALWKTEKEESMIHAEED